MTDQRTCIVCHRQALEPTERQTCVGCLARTRNALAETVELYALLPGELTGHVGAARPPDAVGKADTDGLPEALVMLGGGTAGTVNGTRPTATDPTGRAHAADVWPADPPSVLGVLGTWEDDWRDVAGLPAATVEATAATCSEFLLGRLGWAAQQHPAFDEFAADVRQLVAMLQHVTRRDDVIDRGAKIPCPDCGRPLIRHYADPDPCTHRGPHRERGCDQGGRRDDWRCSSRACGRLVTEREYWFAVAAYEQELAATDG